jgi:hypothetical protein
MPLPVNSAFGFKMRSGLEVVARKTRVDWDVEFHGYQNPDICLPLSEVVLLGKMLRVLERHIRLEDA